MPRHEPEKESGRDANQESKRHPPSYAERLPSIDRLVMPISTNNGNDRRPPPEAGHAHILTQV